MPTTPPRCPIAAMVASRSSLPRADPSRDYLWVQRPRLARCSARSGLAAALASGSATAAGAVDVRGDDVAFGAGQSSVSYPFTVVADTCLELELVAEGDGAELSYLIAVRADGLAHALAMGEARAGQRARVSQLSLHDWHERDVSLEVHVTRRSSAEGLLRLVRPRLERCRR